MGSSFVRARIIGNDIYEPAAPVLDVTPTPDRSQFLREVVGEVEGAASGTLGTSGSRSSIPGRRHERNDRSLRAGQDRRPAQGRGLKLDRRLERTVRTRAAGWHAGRLRAPRQRRVAHGCVGGQAREDRSQRGAGPVGAPLAGLRRGLCAAEQSDNARFDSRGCLGRDQRSRVGSPRSLGVGLSGRPCSREGGALGKPAFPGGRGSLPGVSRRCR